MIDRLHYREHTPPAALRPWVTCVWRIRGTADGPRQHRVLPDGCADLLLDLHSSRQGGPGTTQLVGPMNRAVVVDLDGEVDFIGVRFAPAACGNVTGTAAHELADLAADSSQLPMRLRPSADMLADPAATPDPVGSLFEVCRHALLQHAGPDLLVRAAVRRLLRDDHAGPLRVSVLAHELGVGMRNLERRFMGHLGMTPAGFRRLIRFRKVMARHEDGERNWAVLAAMAGYSDQAHLTREFRAFAGITPTEWAASRSGTVGFLQDDDVPAP